MTKNNIIFHKSSIFTHIINYLMFKETFNIPILPFENHNFGFKFNFQLISKNKIGKEKIIKENSLFIFGLIFKNRKK